MHIQKPSPRSEYREQELERTAQSATLAEKFPELTALTASITHFAPRGVLQTRAIKYTFNIAQAKSFLRFDCQNPECIRGDFDLSEELVKAVAARQKIASGEAVCQGWRTKATIGSIRCESILRYKLSLAYKPAAMKPK